MNAFRRRAERYRIDKQVEIVARKNKSGNIKPMSQQKLIDIISRNWNDVPEKIVKKSFKLTGSYGIEHHSFLSHQPILKLRFR